jgi:hypothetical protein
MDLNGSVNGPADPCENDDRSSGHGMMMYELLGGRKAQSSVLVRFNKTRARGEGNTEHEAVNPTAKG